jgi:hypothetical protein
MADRGVTEDAEILQRALGKHAAEHVRKFAESLVRKGDADGAARWQRIAETLKQDTSIEA